MRRSSYTRRVLAERTANLYEYETASMPPDKTPTVDAGANERKSIPGGSLRERAARVVAERNSALYGIAAVDEDWLSRQSDAALQAIIDSGRDL